jgi:hypothetical protein
MLLDTVGVKVLVVGGLPMGFGIYGVVLWQRLLVDFIDWWRILGVTPRVTETLIRVINK